MMPLLFRPQGSSFGCWTLCCKQIGMDTVPQVLNWCLKECPIRCNEGSKAEINVLSLFPSIMTVSVYTVLIQRQSIVWLPYYILMLCHSR